MKFNLLLQLQIVYALPLQFAEMTNTFLLLPLQTPTVHAPSWLYVPLANTSLLLLLSILLFSNSSLIGSVLRTLLAVQRSSRVRLLPLPLIAFALSSPFVLQLNLSRVPPLPHLTEFVQI
jgi:hypothetical protein